AQKANICAAITAPVLNIKGFLRTFFSTSAAARTVVLYVQVLALHIVTFGEFSVTKIFQIVINLLLALHSESYAVLIRKIKYIIKTFARPHIQVAAAEGLHGVNSHAAFIGLLHRLLHVLPRAVAYAEA